MKRRLWAVVKALAWIAVMLLLKVLVEQYDVGETLRLATYNLQQSRLSAAARDQELPIVVLDISDLGTPCDVTPRQPLRALIQTIVAQDPAAVGIDVDFSPSGGQFIAPEDPMFFDFCLEQRKNGTPVLLGIYRTTFRTPDAWLGGEKYRELAANLLVPRNDGRKMVRAVKIPGIPEADSSRSLCAALAEAAAEAHPEPASDVPWWQRRLRSAMASAGKRLAWAVEAVSERSPGGLTARDLSLEEFLVDYGPLEELQKPGVGTLPAKSPEVVAELGQRLRDKIVLIGRATLGKALDTFVVPGRPRPVPGVYVHACAAYTLLKGPLYELTEWGRLAMDAALSLLVAGIALLISCYYSLRVYGQSRRRGASLRPAERPVLAEERLHRFITGVVVIVVFLAATTFVRLTRLMWDDYLLVIVALLVHQPLEHWFTRTAPRIGQAISRAWHELALERPEEGEG